MFKNKTLLITGGTGSFGNAVLNKFLDSDIKEIRIFSRDEKKQDDMRRKYQNDKIKYFIGDVRSENSLNQAIVGVDYIFHAAALKQVPSCEFYPMEAVQTNIIGTENMLNSAIKHNVKKVICLSTDKAVYPINAMGVSKSLMEKVFVAKSRINSETTIIGTRYGNVMASRGSVIPLFYNQLVNDNPLTLTNPDMTRFMMTLDNAVELVLFAFKNGKTGDIFVQKAPSTTMEKLAEALRKDLDVAQICCTDGYNVDYQRKHQYYVDWINERHEPLWQMAPVARHLYWVEAPMMSVAVGKGLPHTTHDYTPYNDGVSFTGQKQKKPLNNCWDFSNGD